MRDVDGRRPAAVVGVDVGGTKTHIATIDTRGERSDVIIPSSAWREGDVFAHPDNLVRLASAISDGARVVDHTRIVIGLHDCDTAEQGRAARAALADELHARNVIVANDGELLGWAENHPTSVQLIVGTGSVVLGRTAAGVPVRALGNGWLFDDAGSAPALLREAVASIASTHDDPDISRDPLAQFLFSDYAVSDVPSLASAVARDAGPAEWGTRAPLVFEAMRLGSPIARRVVQRAADSIASAIASVRARGAVADSIVAAGGVIVNQEPLRAAIQNSLAALSVDLPLHVIAHAPVEGAVRWAQSLTPPRNTP
ncbi:BadF/BadG/BcrA/BcrD ATPase family protein [Microbacterium indicum]|uniref:BadF/BadG/BcrA/BcrD ATPase family protein n=1 Tax=Microbacterium indicum TaxID=358100 RepID=UPI0003FE1069|nr:BadF/BadG/BcrA/BcrD ATPase family protein [Microbacterium indicum]